MQEMKEIFFAYKIPSGGGYFFQRPYSVMVALITVSFHSVRTTIDNPVHALRTEGFFAT